MALRILDGNQTSTTLATTVSGGAHYPNHIIASAVTISSLPAISGTVTANVSYFENCLEGFDESVNDLVVAVHVKNFNGDVFGSTPFPISGTVTIGSALPTGTNRIGVVTIGGGTVTIGAGTAQIGSVTASLSNAVSPQLPSNYSGDPYPVGSKIIPVGGWTQENDGAHWQGLSISDQGAVYAQLATGYSRIGVVTVGNSVTISSLPVQLSTTTIGGTARLNVTLSSATTIGATAPSYGNLYGGSDGTSLRAISVDTSGRTVVTGSVSVASTTVTISAQPSGALTTRFGSVTTANTAQITTAVTNTSRKYLLVQNNQTGTSAGTVTIGIGFTPTTTQGIQLISGASYTADSFVPTGAVYWLGSVTGATFTILEG